MTYAAARAEAAEVLSPGMGALLRTPNNILGIEYCKAILGQNSPLRPMPLPRWGAAHGGKAGKYNGNTDGQRQLSARPPHGGVGHPFVPQQAMVLYRKAGAEGHLLDPRRLENGIAGAAAGGTAGAFSPGCGASAKGWNTGLAAAVREATSLEDLYNPPEN